MNQKSNLSFTSPLVRMISYFIVFIADAIAFELLRSFISPRSSVAVILVVLIIVSFALVGSLLIRERGILSWITSAATLTTLGFMGLAFSALPTCILALAAGITYLGARAVLTP